MQINQRMFDMFKKTNLREADLAKHLNVSTGQISTWKVRQTDPPAKYINEICKFFDVSVDYLLTGIESVAKDTLSEEEKIMLEQYKVLNYEQKMYVKNILLVESWKAKGEEERVPVFLAAFSGNTYSGSISKEAEAEIEAMYIKQQAERDRNGE